MNARNKGQRGEREIADILNKIIHKVKIEKGYSEYDINNPQLQVQRNQQQTAIGGSDLTNTPLISVEVKRQEILSINKWWEQTCKSALDDKASPVLIYKQNRKSWRACVYGYLLHNSDIPVRVDVSLEDFLCIYETMLEGVL